MGGKEKYQTFKPRRRAFARRPRAMFSLGAWTMGFAGAAFGGVVAAGWLRAPEARPKPAPVAETQPLAQPAPMETAVLIIEAAPAPLPAAPVVTAAAAVPPPAEDAAPASMTGVAGKIIDGDTFYLEGVETRLRLWGVDAPEKNAPGAAEATEALTALIAGKPLTCEEMDRDRYARIVARCTLEDGRDVARIMIDIGAASEMVRYSGGYYGG
jgi:endonuclease YncB( thermonuclease family)